MLYKNQFEAVTSISFKELKFAIKKKIPKNVYIFFDFLFYSCFYHQERAPPAGAGSGEQGPQHQHRPHLPQPHEHQQGHQPPWGHWEGKLFSQVNIFNIIVFFLVVHLKKSDTFFVLHFVSSIICI